MGYVVVGLLFLLVLAAAAVLFTRLSRTIGDDPVETPFSGDDQTPAGDSAEHAGEQDAEGRTTDEVEGDHPLAHPREEPTREGHPKRDPIGGEGEGETVANVGHIPRP